MKNIDLPFNKDDIEKLTKNFPTPFHIYDREGIEKKINSLKKAFSWNSGFKNFFAVKALPNPYILKIMQENGFGADCSSAPELILSEKSGIIGENIMFTSNDTPSEEFVKAAELGAIINLDDISHIDFLEKSLGKLPELISFRYNPGSLRSGNTIIGHPEEAKYGLTREQLFDGYAIAKDRGVKRFGLHTMIASNELDYNYFVETADMLFDLAIEIKERLGISLEFVNMGGGIGIPYRLEENEIDFEKIGKNVESLYKEKIVKNGLDPLNIYMENGRVITGPNGYMVTTAIHKKETYKHYIGVDSSMANLMRPGLYGAYHHITVLGKENEKLEETYDIVGSLCENNDKFAINRELPKIDIGDFLVLHDTGAHGHAMGFNYNGKLRSAEFLMNSDKSFKLIRRKETIDDYFATLNFDEL